MLEVPVPSVDPRGHWEAVVEAGYSRGNGPFVRIDGYGEQRRQ